jgi:hypothetical protein
MPQPMLICILYFVPVCLGSSWGLPMSQERVLFFSSEIGREMLETVSSVHRTELAALGLVDLPDHAIEELSESTMLRMLGGIATAEEVATSELAEAYATKMAHQVLRHALLNHDCEFYIADLDRLIARNAEAVRAAARGDVEVEEIWSSILTKRRSITL